MSVFSKILESLGKSISKELDKSASKNLPSQKVLKEIEFLQGFLKSAS